MAAMPLTRISRSERAVTVLSLVVLVGSACSSSPSSSHGGSGSGAGSSGSASTGTTTGTSGAGGGSGAISGASTGNGSAGSATTPDAGSNADAALAPTSATSPDFGPNVIVFDPSMPMATIQSKIDAVYANQYTDEFGPNRYTYLFKPGTYNLNVTVGYYTQVLGLGQSPDDVAITGAVKSTGDSSGDATGSFWRGCENVSITPAGGRPNMWAVSQGATLRRVHVKGALVLADSGTSSGGFMADSKIDTQVSSGSQQQWFSRNSEWAGWAGGVWNMVFVGTVNPPAGTWPVLPYSVTASTPLVQEKPFLFLDAAGSYAVRVPDLRLNSQGTSWGAAPTTGTTLSLAQFYLAHADKDTAATINAALAQGRHLILTPGIYHLESTLRVSQPNTIVLGLGLATLVPDTASPSMIVADVDGVRIGGIIFDAGANNSPTLLVVGDPGNTQAHAQNPTSLYDVFCRVGGGTSGTATSCVTIHSSNVVGDNLWLWRADHGAGAAWGQNTSATGLIVNGNGVTMYGLAVEHFQQYQTMWNGNQGQLFFYQSELPYDPPDQPSWQHGGVNGYASYKVADSVTTHSALGMGVYSAFQSTVVDDNAIEAPAAGGVGLHHIVTVWLSGAPGSAISHVISGAGAAVNTTSHKATVN
jgi:hypothetical protein